MVNASRIIKGLTNVGSDTFSHVHIKAPVQNPEGDNKLAGEISKQASDGASSYGKAIITKKINCLQPTPTMKKK